MEKVGEIFTKITVKAEILDEAMQVIPQKYIAEFSELSRKKQELKSLEVEIKESLKEYNQEFMERYKDVKSSINRVQMKMLTLLQCLEEQDKHKQTAKRALQPIEPGTPKLLEREGAVQAFSELNTPRMLVDDYAKSPFVKKRTKVALQFSDFEAFISEQDFKSVPAYMRGRVSLFELQEFLDNIVVKAFNSKYRILHLKTKLNPFEWKLQSMFKSQESYFEGQKFVTVGDLARILERNVDKKHDRQLQMLRHLQIIREARKGNVSCYVWLKK